MKKEKSFLIGVISSIFLILLTVTGLNYYCDPLQIFKYTEYGNGEQRFLNYGIARNYNYDTAIIGTSTSENILKNDVKKYLGLNAVNLSLSGSTNYEQRELLKEILKNKNLKKVIYGLDVFSYNRDIDEIRLEIPNYIKSPYSIDGIKQFLNFITLKNSAKSLIKNILSKNNKSWIDTHSYWGNDYVYSINNTLNFDINSHYGAKNIGTINTIKNGYSLKKMKNNFDLFLELTQQNKNIEYTIYFPPYASLFWYFIEKYDSLDTILEFKQYVLEKTTLTNNIKIHDFQNNFEIVENLDNYKDMVHYGPKINNKILELIKEENYIENLQNYEKNKILLKNEILEWKQNYSNLKI
ncbi:MAG: hypothetical protein ACRCZ9_03780 [Fusobacteriaceae bacterium]